MKLAMKQPVGFAGRVPDLLRFAAAQGCVGAQIDVPRRAEVPAIAQAVRETGVAIVSVSAMSCRMLGPDPAAMLHEHLQVERALAIAAELGAPFVSQFVGHDPGCDIAANVATFARVYEGHVAVAERLGLRLAFENCPMADADGVARNLFHSPEHWDACMAAIDSPAVAMELDVSHLPALGLDPLPILRAYLPRIAHVQIKDVRIDVRRREGGGPVTHGHCPVGEGGMDVAGILGELDALGYDGFVTGDLHGRDHDAVARNLAGIRRCAAAAGVALETAPAAAA